MQPETITTWSRDALIVAAAALACVVGNGDFRAPPRYDGAGYAVLGRSLEQGTGYRSIDHPDQPRHAHFPPGYPAFLALTWRLCGNLVPAAHWMSCLCMVGATLAAWWWFRDLHGGQAALLLALALAVNWTWSRTGSAIQSEPLYTLLAQIAILCTLRTSGSHGIFSGLAPGVLLAACFLTRHVALGLAGAVLLDLLLRRNWPGALAASIVLSVLTAPWLAWMAVVGAEQRTQASALLAGAPELAARLATQGWFYLQRIPDQVTGPFVEIATVFRPSWGSRAAANLWALAATGLVTAGWWRAARRPRSRLAGLIPMFTLPLLVSWPYTEAGRFLVPLIPCILIGGLEGLVLFGRWTSRRLGRTVPPRDLRRAAAAVILASSVPYAGYHLVTGRARTRDAANQTFDLACQWLARTGGRPGPVLTRHPGEVFLATGRQALEASSSERPGDLDARPDEVEGLIARYHVAYLLIDEDRYRGAPLGPLPRFVQEHPGRVRRVWPEGADPAAVVIQEVLPDRQARTGGDQRRTRGPSNRRRL